MSQTQSNKNQSDQKQSKNKIEKQNKKNCAAIFDCDGTLSAIEGITQLAQCNNVGAEVRALTEQAMGTGQLSTELYNNRLQLTKPSAQQCEQLAEDYFLQRSKNIEKLIDNLHANNIDVFVLSAGIEKSVLGFTRKLNIADENVYSVPVTFCNDGSYLDFDHNNPLTTHQGKSQIAAEIRKKYAALIYIGDGANDLCCKKHVDYFIGLGTHFPRENIAEASDFYYTEDDMLGLLKTINKINK